MVEDRRPQLAQRVMNQEIAERAARAAQAKAAELGAPISVAVVDESGNLVYFVKGDGANFHTFETARGKAVTSAAFRRPTHEMVDGFRGNPAFWAGLAESLHMMPGAGGHPLSQNGVMIGAVGCGGALGDVDEQCSEAGANAVST